MAKDGKTLEDLKAQAATKAAEGKKSGSSVKKTVDNITFKKGSGTEAVFGVLDKASTPLAEKVVVERASKYGDGHKPERCASVLKWLVREGVAVKNDEGLISLAERKPEPAEESADQETETADPDAAEDGGVSAMAGDSNGGE